MIEIIPAIDLIGGNCVRLSQGDFSQSRIYSHDPLEVARGFESAGLQRLHIVDLDGARTGKVSNLAVLERIASSTDLKIDFGGGIKTTDDLKGVFDAGASMASIGSVAVKAPDKFFGWVERYGSEKLLLGADVRDGNLLVDGWQTVTAMEIVPFLLEYFAKRVRQVFITDIAKDGVLQGPSIELYKQIREALPDLTLIASGGVSCMDDIHELGKIGCSAVIVGKAIYEGKTSIKDLASYNKNVSKTNNSMS
jgi:phosphoribosylformimino-5-aminoimidazole carboxamide ribotide isomerase